MPPLSDQKNDQDAQWSPKPRKFCFCVTAAARPLCLPCTTKSAVVAQQVVLKRQSGGRTIAKVAEGLPWSPDGGTVVATVIAQWTRLVGQRRHNGGTRKAEALLKLIHNVNNSTYFLRGDQWPTTVHPFCHHGDVCAFLLPPSSDLWATDLLGDLCATVLNMLKTSRRPWRCLNVLCTTIERPRQPFCLPSAFNGDLASFVVAQWRQKGRSSCGTESPVWESTSWKNMHWYFYVTFHRWFMYSSPEGPLHIFSAICYLIIRNSPVWGNKEIMSFGRVRNSSIWHNYRCCIMRTTYFLIHISSNAISGGWLTNSFVWHNYRCCLMRTT